MDEAIQRGHQRYEQNVSKDHQITYYHAAQTNQTTPVAEFARHKKISVTEAASLWKRNKGVYLPFRSFPMTQ